MNTFNTELDRLLHSQAICEAEIIEYLLTYYYADLRHLASNILRDADEAEDAAQETLIAALSKLDRYQPGTNFKAWLYTIAVNVCRGYLRKRKVQTNLHNMLAGLFHLGDSISSPEEQALRGEAQAYLWQAVNTLDEKRRLPVVLHYLHGLSNDEVPTGEVFSIITFTYGFPDPYRHTCDWTYRQYTWDGDIFILIDKWEQQNQPCGGAGG